MIAHFRCTSRCCRALIVSIGCAGMILSCPCAASGQITKMYSFEPDLEGFAAVGGGLTVSQETSGLGATDGVNSMKLEFTDFSSFAGARTSTIHSAFNDPLGVDFVRFDLTNTNRFAPPATTPPTPGVPTFASASITFFGTLPGNPVSPAQIQFFFAEEAVGRLEPGTHQINIDLRNAGGPQGTGKGLNVDTGDVKGYDAYVAAGFVPLEFQIYINKSLAFGDPAFAWTIYIDNIRAGRDVGVPGDYNGNVSVDAADYVLWRNGGPLFNEVADEGTVSNADYTEWRARFGNVSGSGSGLAMATVPEPNSSWMILTAVLLGWWRRSSSNWTR
jgi:hypothetical protein